MESIDHVLSTGQVALEIWKKISASMFGIIFCAYKSWFDRMSLRFHKARKISQLEILIGIIPIVVM